MKPFVFWGMAAFHILPLHAQTTFRIQGEVLESEQMSSVTGAIVTIVEQPHLKAITDAEGRFEFEEVPGGIVSFRTEAVGFRTKETPDYVIASTTPTVRIVLDEDIRLLQDITVRPSPFRRTAESPVSMQVIGIREIEKMPGSNRDISRIVRSYPGVSFSPIGYRNDLIVRGGGPSENSFYLNGIEIPNINHFATQGASGGPVSLINADLIREIRFYTGAFPADRSGSMSSVLDISLREGNRERQTFKATLGSSEASLSGSGHIGKRSTYLYSVRQSYLQFLFRLLGLPLLPNYIDGQIYFNIQVGKNDELSFLALAGIDRMKLNLDIAGDEASDYLLGYLPVIRQETFTVGSTYRHRTGVHTQTYTLSHSFLNNGNVKYVGNDHSTPEKLSYRRGGTEQKTTIRVENATRGKQGWTYKQGIRIDHMNSLYEEKTRQLYPHFNEYRSTLNITNFRLYTSSEYRSADERFQGAAGLVVEGNTNNRKSFQIWRWLSPRASLRYEWDPHWSAAFSTGLYHQLPPLTALGYRNTDGILCNNDLTYMRVGQQCVGITWKYNEQFALSLEGFYKRYRNIPVSISDGIALTCKGADYGVIGNEALEDSGEGKAYGGEMLVRWVVPQRLHLTGSFTYYRSRYRASPHSSYINSSWDHRYILNVSGTYDLPRAWSIGARLSAIGGAPFTPYDEDRSSLVSYWDAHGRPSPDYNRYNTLRFPAFVQLDLRLDKDFYFRKWHLNVYVDLQNATLSKIREQDALVSSGKIANPSAPVSEQRYVMKHIRQESGALVPGIGIAVEF